MGTLNRQPVNKIFFQIKLNQLRKKILANLETWWKFKSEICKSIGLLFHIETCWLKKSSFGESEAQTSIFWTKTEKWEKNKRFEKKALS